MDMHTAIDTMMKRTKTTGSALSLSFGRDRNSVSTMLSRHSAPRLDRFLRMADFMGYKVVLERGDDRIEVDPPKE